MIRSALPWDDDRDRDRDREWWGVSEFVVGEAVRAATSECVMVVGREREDESGKDWVRDGGTESLCEKRR